MAAKVKVVWERDEREAAQAACSGEGAGPMEARATLWLRARRPSVSSRV